MFSSRGTSKDKSQSMTKPSNIASPKNEVPVKLNPDNSTKTDNAEILNLLAKLQEGQEDIIRNQDGIKARLDGIENDVADLRDEIIMLGKGQQENRESIEGLKTLKDAVDWQYDSIQRLQFEQMSHPFAFLAFRKRNRKKLRIKRSA